MTRDEEVAVRDAAVALADALVGVFNTRRDAAPAPDQLYTIDQACRVMACGRTLLYSELAAGRLRSLKVGRRRLIPGSAIAEYVRAGDEQ